VIFGTTIYQHRCSVCKSTRSRIRNARATRLIYGVIVQVDSERGQVTGFPTDRAVGPTRDKFNFKMLSFQDQCWNKLLGDYRTAMIRAACDLYCP
jgi:hypothetical protein